MTNNELITKLKEAVAKAAEEKKAKEENARLFLEKLRAMVAKNREQQQ